MIVSASFRTDIPAFYSTWFMNRLDAGYCMVRNPYSNQSYRVSLKRDDVDGFVFWTKNIGPLLDKLPEIKERGYPFMVQYTINGYPRTLEYSVVDAKRSCQHIHALAELYGPRVALWRYDPIVFSSVTPASFHRENFARLAESLEGATDEVFISFAEIYKKTERNMNWAAHKFGFDWHDPDKETKVELVKDFVQIANAHKMQLSVCSQPDYVVPGAIEARCVDAKRLSDIAGEPISAKIKGNRPDCGCYISRDIGAYDTCPHGCVYCYAVNNRKKAQQNYKEHNPQSPYLFGDGPDELQENKPTQHRLL